MGQFLEAQCRGIEAALECIDVVTETGDLQWAGGQAQLFGQVLGQIPAQQFTLLLDAVSQLLGSPAEGVSYDIPGIAGQLPLPINLQFGEELGDLVAQRGIASQVHLAFADQWGELVRVAQTGQGTQRQADGCIRLPLIAG